MRWRAITAGDFKMRFPTVRTLEEFADFADVETLINAMRAKRNIPTILPRIRGSGARVLPGRPWLRRRVKAGSARKMETVKPIIAGEVVRLSPLVRRVTAQIPA
jgi:hypothetical protein